MCEKRFKVIKMCPLVKIDIIEGKSKEYKKAVLEGVHQALVKTLGIPDSDRFQRLYESPISNFQFLLIGVRM